MSRIRIFVLFATLAALATALAACGGGSSTDSSSEGAQTTIDSATLKGVKSANLELELGVKSDGGNFNLSFSGPFQTTSGQSLPQLDLAAKATGSVQGKPVDFEGDLTLLSDRAFIGYQGTEYEVDPTTFGFVKSSFEQGQQKGEAGANACQEAAGGLQFSEFLENPSSEAGVEVDGTKTTKVSGDLDVGGAVDALIKFAEDPACASEIESTAKVPLDQLKSAKGQLTDALKDAHAEVYVGEDDIIRKLVVEFSAEEGGEKIQLELDLSLGAVNEPQHISAPPNAKPLEGLFQKLGVNPVELLEASSSGNPADFGALLGKLLQGGGNTSTGSGLEAPSAAGQQAYLECLQGAETPTDLQKCASEVQ